MNLVIYKIKVKILRRKKCPRSCYCLSCCIPKGFVNEFNYITNNDKI